MAASPLPHAACPRSRQELEQGYFKEWNEMSRAALQEGKAPMTPWTLLAALPHMIRYHVVSRKQRRGWR